MDKPRFQLSRVAGTPVTDAELLDDLRKVAARLGQDTVSSRKYDEVGIYSWSTLSIRFGTWNNALEAAGLKISNECLISDDRLFENILSLWQRYGRQPRLAELGSQFSEFSSGPYIRRFGSWTAALLAFVEYANANTADGDDTPEQPDLDGGKRTSRDPSLRLRYKVLLRDGFKCCLCGASPAITAGVTLHIDHIQPWSKRGETTLENLRTTCEICNLGKGNLTEVRS